MAVEYFKTQMAYRQAILQPKKRHLDDCNTTPYGCDGQWDERFPIPRFCNDKHERVIVKNIMMYYLHLELPGIIHSPIFRCGLANNALMLVG